MILSRHFVFVHFPKSGGTFVRRLCQEHAPDDWQIRLVPEHPTVREIPGGYRHLPVLGFVRNPFDWYVSWYFYLRARGDNAFFNALTADGRRGFKETLAAVFDLDLPEILQVDCPHPTSPFACYLAYTFGADLDAVVMGKFENLRADLIRMLEQTAGLEARVRKRILDYPVVNKSRRGHYHDYYDDDLRRLVTERDAPVLSRYQYAF